MPVAEAIGLGAAVDWLSGIGMDAVREHARDVVGYALERLREVAGPRRSTARRDLEQRGSWSSFALDGIHPHDVAEILGREGVCVRAGHHCAQPLMRRLGVPATTRASFAVHSTREDVDRLVDGLGTVRGGVRLMDDLYRENTSSTVGERVDQAVDVVARGVDRESRAVVAATPRRRISGCAQWWPARTQTPSRPRISATSCGCDAVERERDQRRRAARRRAGRGS